MPEIIVKLGERIVNRYRFDKDIMSIGRARDNDVVIENLSVSRNHARIKREGGEYILTDLNSANGSLVNGHRVTKTAIRNNDVLTIGKHNLTFLEVEETHFVEERPAPPSRPSAPIPPKKQTRYPSRSPVITPTSSSSSSEVGPTETMVGVLTVMEGRQKGREYRITEDEVGVGRSTRNPVRVHDWQASSAHALIRREGGGYVISDLDSWHGTIVNDQKVSEAKLRNGDKVQIGETVLAFRLVTPESLTAPTELHHVALPITDFEAEEVVLSGGDSSGSLDLHLEDGMDLAIDESFDPPQKSTSKAVPTEARVTSESHDLTGFDDDEFAPFTEEELEALEADEMPGDADQEREDLRSSWELVEDEKMIELDADSENFSLIENEEALRREEEAALDLENMASMGRRLEEEEIKVEDAEEEGELFTGEVPDKDPAEEVAPPPAPAAQSDTPGEQSSSSISGVFAPPPELTPEVEKEIALWEKALRNKSRIIRKNAARELKRLTGKDYDWKSEPSGH
ncbi:MAG: FHA domain-containing protein [Candidatus Sumerlaeia bacterium]|nr:FHA domain-containing protein [Candidatus Sumerlaeia bacterium]